MQLLVDPETSVNIETKMATLNAETLNGRTTNGLGEEVDKKIVNDNKENVIVNEDCSTSDKDETKNTSDSLLGLTNATKANDVKEIVEKIISTETENVNLSNNKTGGISERNLADICIETDKQSEARPHVDKLLPNIITEAQNSNPSVDKDVKTEELLKSESLSVTQITQDSDSIVSNDVAVKDINSKCNGVIETSQTQHDTINESKETVVSINNETTDIDNSTGLPRKKNDDPSETHKDGEALAALESTDLGSEVPEKSTGLQLEKKDDPSETMKDDETVADLETTDLGSEIPENSTGLQLEEKDDPFETMKDDKTAANLEITDLGSEVPENSTGLQLEEKDDPSDTMKDDETVSDLETTDLGSEVPEKSTGLQLEKKDDPSETMKDDETVADLENTDLDSDVPDNTIVYNEENSGVPNSSEKIQLELNDTPMSIDDDSHLRNRAEECNNTMNIETILDDELKADIKPSQENVSEDISMIESTKLESNLDKTMDVYDSKEEINMKDFNTEVQITDNKAVVKKIGIEESTNYKIQENTVICVASKDKNDLKTPKNTKILDSIMDKDIKYQDDCNKSQKSEAENEVNNLQSDKDTEVETLATVEANDSIEKTSSKLKELLNQPSSRIKLSNTMNILSDEDDDDDKPGQEATKPLSPSSENRCINLVEDDDCMLIDEDTCEQKSEKVDEKQLEKQTPPNDKNSEILTEKSTKAPEEEDNSKTKDDSLKEVALNEEKLAPIISEKEPEKNVENKKEKPLIPKTFLQNCKRKLSDMTRDDLEEFCVLKIAEAVIDRTNLSDIKTKLKVMNQNIEEYKKKALILTRQNRDLQVVLKSVQEEQKKKTNTPIIPLKITRSVGMQVVMVDKPVRRKGPSGAQAPVNNTPSPSPTKILRNNMNTTNQRQPASPSNPIPVPRLVPAQTFTKAVVMQSSPKPIVNNIPNGAKKSPSIQQKPEKRPLSRQQTTSQSDTVDLTDDEPPAKANRTASANMPVRLVQQQSLMAPRVPNIPQTNNQRKVYIPISSSHAEGLKVGQKIMLRGVRPPDPVVIAPQVRGPPATKVIRLPNTPPRSPRPNMTMRHPAPLPDSHKQYQPPNWKSVPPAPDLKLSKVENGIVISWKIDGYLEDKFEEIASYQLYAYQETSAAPSTLLWKKIGDVKALPLPMACTLTQFMAGYKYYFAVRAVDVKSRVGPFSMPGSILLLNKV